MCMVEIRNRKTLQSKVNICKSDVKIGDYANSLCASNQAEPPRLVPLSGHGGTRRLESHYSFESEIYGARTAIYQTSTSIMRGSLFIQ